MKNRIYLERDDLLILGLLLIGLVIAILGLYTGINEVIDWLSKLISRIGFRN
ncbi:MAG: hypothetical protein K9J12_15045 [Melioribacteraceae bacterium]|nr:hypothetical protein [Melioribacteraceae bacterium]MCF8264751.1 hypothetical protein [Melioribacteraceae bacterium]MCF8431681.1 hypothetical protein [Melioribacteraceae bacterium]